MEQEKYHSEEPPKNDEKGEFQIPSIIHFWASLNENTLSILSSR
jgi:hypothetical protein